MNRTPQRRRMTAVASLTLASLVAVLLQALPAHAETRAAEPPKATEAAPWMPDRAAVTDRIIVKFHAEPGRSAEARTQAYGRAAKAVGLQRAQSPRELRGTGNGARVVRVPMAAAGRNIAKLVAELEADPAVAYAEPDTIMYPAAAQPNDEYYGYQWNLWDHDAGIRAADAWTATRGEGVVVAVVDTGITPHPDLDANVLPGYDMISDAASSRDGDGRDADPRDEGDWYEPLDCGSYDAASISSWHGTHVAGIVAARAGDGLGVAGVAPGASILPVRALGACGGYTSDIADGITWAAGGDVPGVPANGTPARVVNLSLGGTATCSATFQTAIDGATAAGAVVVVAAGNETANAATSSPANCGNVIAVAASGSRGALAPYSNFGALVDVMAPGGDMARSDFGGVLSTLNDGDTVPGAPAHYFSAGTSMAAPHVAGTAALMLAAAPSLTPAQVESRIKSAARAVSCASGCGAGRLDAPRALGIEATLGTAMRRGTTTVFGIPSVGRTLTARPGTWEPADAAFTYQWYSDGFLVSGATGRQYVATEDDFGTDITVRVRATKTGYRTLTQRSADFGPILYPLATSTPTVSGTRTVGHTLRAVPGTWTTGTSLTYQWYRSGVAVSGAKYATHRLTASDAGKRLSVRVTGRKTDHTTASRLSAATTAVAKGTLTGAVPTISGTRKVGYALKAVPGTWTYRTTLRYQWYRSGVAIPGATSQSYRLAGADAGKRMGVRVTGTKTGYNTLSRLSAATATVAKGTLVGATPTVSGTARVGYTLKAVPGTWTPNTTLRYQWYRSGYAIRGATGQSYRLVSADRWRTLKVRVTGHKLGYVSTYRTSAATATVR
ncbi:S8 family serine peptidase [Arthrobacter sp. KK5.5]|uniref:S8 family serine peptidase n=1 Tax=Arthrobacter sp. KK5.5 TaxID=3373084 RepID=UPI003EE5F7EE